MQDIHILAFMLNPYNSSRWEDVISSNKERVIDFLENYGGEKVLEAFFSYVSQEDSFHSSKSFWEYKSKPKLFWNMVVSLHC